jgi:hypothetical protein
MVKIIKHDDGVWTTAQANHAGKPYYVETKHYEQPKAFGIQNGKISKLFIYAGTSWDEKRCVCAYDCGWSKLPETRAAKAISNEIIAMYN